MRPPPLSSLGPLPFRAASVLVAAASLGACCAPAGAVSERRTSAEATGGDCSVAGLEAWAQAVGVEHARTGRAEGADNPEAAASAVVSAYEALLRPLGVKVSGSARYDASEQLSASDGRRRSTYKETRRVIRTVELGKIEVRGHTMACFDAARGQALAVAGVSAREWRRLERVRAKRALLVVQCDGTPPQACNKSVSEAAAKAAAIAGLRVLQPVRRLQPLPDPVRLGVEHRALYVLVIGVRGAPPQYLPAYARYAVRAAGHASLHETSDGTMIWASGVRFAVGNAFLSGPRLDTAVARAAREEAARSALVNAIKEATEPLAYAVPTGPPPGP